MNESRILLLGADMRPTAICDDFISLRFSEEFTGVGDFELVLAADSAHIPAEDTYVLCGGGLIYIVERKTVDSAAGTVTISGRSLLSLLSRRIVPYVNTARKSPEAEICALVRGFASDLFNAPLDVQYESQSAVTPIVVEAGELLGRLVFLASSVSKGLSLTYNEYSNHFNFTVRDIRDCRASNVVGNEPVLLSEQMRSIGSLRESVDRSHYLNRVTVHSTAGTGTTYSVTVLAADYVFPDGFDDSAEAYRDGYVKSGIGASLFTTRDENNVEHFDSDAFFGALSERGRQHLAMHRVKRTLSAELCGSVGEQARAGDICTLFTPLSSVTTALITRMEYSVKNGVRKCTAQLLAY